MSCYPIRCLQFLAGGSPHETCGRKVFSSLVYPCMIGWKSCRERVWSLVDNFFFIFAVRILVSIIHTASIFWGNRKYRNLPGTVEPRGSACRYVFLVPSGMLHCLVIYQLRLRCLIHGHRFEYICPKSKTSSMYTINQWER